MTALRRRLPRFAALVLLVWLFATGVAMAQSCAATVDLECIECCDEMKAAGAFNPERDNVVAPAQLAVALPPAQTAPEPAWQPGREPQAFAPDPPDPGGQRIPIVFLRLAL